MTIQGFNIDDFKANFEDLARQYTFMIMINFPSTVSSSLGTDRIKYLVNSTTMPASTIEATETHWQGHVFPLGANQTFSDWTITFKLDKNAQLRKDFVEWHRIVHDPETNIHGTPIEYMADQEIWNLNPSGEIVEKLKLVSAWPTTIGELTLDYSANEIQTFEVTWRYLYHVEI